MSPPHVRVLVVEDEEGLAYGLKNNLEFDGYRVAVATTGKRALRVASRWHPEVVILDLILPDIDGLDLIASLRSTQPRLPILILSARATINDRVVGLDRGADDYLTKPFDLLELLARVHALHRRTEQHRPNSPSLPKLEIDVDRASVRVDGREVHLRPMGWKFLRRLYDARGGIVSRDELHRSVWGYKAEPTDSRVIDFQVRAVRRAIEGDPSNPVLLLVTPGIGVRLNPELSCFR
jgi:DNA-binding response OmpR family regulator